jgi:hypothetical protein
MLGATWIPTAIRVFTDVRRAVDYPWPVNEFQELSPNG